MWGFLFMATIYYDGIEWEVDEIPGVISTGDEDDTILEYNAVGEDENGNPLYGTAFFILNRFDALHFDYIMYEPYEEDDDEWEDEE